MIVIYSQDNTIISDNADTAKEVFFSLYGEKLGAEAYATVKDGRIGASYRKYGGPLVKVVSNEDAVRIREKETAVGMM